ncbi:hypothetical protein Salat_0281000 [Sesamum alatum]|uniref:DUF4408 domain-containing protein n=1 Tax=Sesamum alatum TaxID=300844 RepID=A0AAE2CYN1_9LAMI|nr:hypothetical protein Salat_0281000 [Sesamum alatum]
MEGDSIVEAATRIHKSYQFMKKTLQFLVLVSVFSFLYSYFSGFPFFFSYNLQFSTLVFPLLAQALDRKYMFLICNGILAVLAKNLRFSSSSLNMIKSAEDGVKEITELPPIDEETIVEENVASMDVAGADADEKQTQQEQEHDYGGFCKDGIIVESEEWEEEDDDEESRVAEEGTSATEQVIDASVSTEELNKKFEEFIRKMKEEIRVEAQQQLITV